MEDILFIFMALLGPWLGISIGIEAMSKETIRFTYDLPIEAGSANAAVRRLRAALEAVSIATGKPRLECRTMDSDMPNALAAIIKGKPHLLVTSGLLKSDFSERELTAIVAHEAAHIATGEAMSWLRSSFSFLMALNFTLLTIPLIVLVNLLINKPGHEGMSPMLTILLVMLTCHPPILVLCFEGLVSRQDDLFADALAVQVTRDPEALVSCIKKVLVSPGTILYRSFWDADQESNPINVKAAISRYISKYFFVNPFYRDAKLPVEREATAFGYVDPYQDGSIGRVFSHLTSGQLSKYHREQLAFLDKRLMALGYIGHSQVEHAYHGDKTPASEWD